MDSDVLVVSTDSIAGYDITETIGPVFGLVVRNRSLASNIGASLRSIVGSEVRAYAHMLGDSRLEAIGRMNKHARNMGADGVVAVRFDTTNIGAGMSEVVVYGTAVKLKKQSA